MDLIIDYQLDLLMGCGLDLKLTDYRKGRLLMETRMKF
jgi:hypothetical protein